MRGPRCSPTTLCTTAELVSSYQLPTRSVRAEITYRYCPRIVDSSDPLGPIANLDPVGAGRIAAGDATAVVGRLAAGGSTAVVGVLAASKMPATIAAPVVLDQTAVADPLLLQSAQVLPVGQSSYRSHADYHTVFDPLLLLDEVPTDRGGLHRVHFITGTGP